MIKYYLAIILIGLFASTAVLAQNENYVCSFAVKNTNNSALQAQLTPEEWQDIMDGKGEKHHEDWLGNYIIYKTKNIQITYMLDPEHIEGKYMVVEAVWKNEHFPENLQTKHQVAEFFKTPIEVEAKSLELGCECDEIAFAFEGDKVKKLSINYYGCV